MSPRSNAADAASTRRRILNTVAHRASLQGFTQVSTRDIARELAMSKSGVVGPFGSRESLLSAALDTALGAFADSVVSRMEGAPPGHARLKAVTDAWVDYLADCPFPGGCVVTAASIDLDGHPGPLRDQLAQAVRGWRALLAEQFRAMGYRAGVAVDRAALVMGIAMLANEEIQLLADPDAVRRARRLMRAAIEPPPRK